MTLRSRYKAEYYYPGSFMPETTSRDVADPRWLTVVAAGPDQEGYFSKDNWYAVVVREIVEERFTSDSGEERWLVNSNEKVRSYIVGRVFHVDDIPDVDGTRDNSILKSNIRGNSMSQIAVLTRCGNWQMYEDWDEVIEP